MYKIIAVILLFLILIPVAFAFTFPRCNKDQICVAAGMESNPELLTTQEKIDVILQVNKFDLTVMAGAAYDDLKNQIRDYLNNDVTLLYYATLITQNPNEDTVCCPKKDWVTINQNEDWFLHYSTGARWEHPVYPPGTYYHMNTSNPNYRTHIALIFENITNFDSKFDGIFADETGGTYGGWTNYGLGIPWAVPGPAPFTQSEYEQNVIATAQRVKQQLGTKILFTNGAATYLLPSTDGGMIEDFAIKTGSSGNPSQLYYPESGTSGTDWIEHIDNLKDVASNDRILIAQSDYWGVLNHTDRQKVFNFSFTSYLLGKNANSYAVYSFSGPQGNVSLYYPEYDINLGSSQGNYYITAQQIYRRDFQNAIVGVNPGTTSRTFSFSGQTFWKIDGTPVTNSIVLVDHSGIILLRQPPAGVCGNGIVDAGETCSSCPQDVSCGSGTLCCSSACITPICNNNAQCNDNNIFTTDTCVNPGTCIAACTNIPTATCGNGVVDTGETCSNCAQDVICQSGTLCCSNACVAAACTSDAQCNDSNNLTSDTCNNPGTCSSSCSFVQLSTCGNGVVDSGETCSSCPADVTCQSGICCSGVCTQPACYSSNECSDNNIFTIDGCSNEGTCSAQCTFIQSPNSCGNGIKDSGETCSNCPTDYSCEQGNICCSESCIVPTCTGDTQCDDGNSCTTDTCNSGNTCGASCRNEPIDGCVESIIITTPSTDIEVGSEFIVNIFDESGKPINGAKILYGTQEVYTDNKGQGILRAEENINKIYASKEGFRSALLEINSQLPTLGQLGEAFEDLIETKDVILIIIIILVFVLLVFIFILLIKTKNRSRFEEPTYTES